MNLERIADLIASGLALKDVATIVGLTPARISQLSKDSEELRLLVAERSLPSKERDENAKALDAKYLAAETYLVNQVIALAPMSELKDVTAALRVISDRTEKREARKNPIPVAGSTVINNLVQIAMPSHAFALPSFSLSQNNEVMAIGERTLAPMNSEGVEALFESLGGGKEESPALLNSQVLPSTEIEATETYESKSFVENAESLSSVFDYVAPKQEKNHEQERVPEKASRSIGGSQESTEEVKERDLVRETTLQRAARMIFGGPDSKKFQGA